MESPLLPNLITTKQLKLFCVFYFSAPVKPEHLDNFNYCFNSVESTKMASSLTNGSSFATVLPDFLLWGSGLYILLVLGAVIMHWGLLMLPGNVEGGAL